MAIELHTAAEEIQFDRLGPKSGSQLVIAGGHGGIGAALAAAASALGVRVVSLDTKRAIADNPLPADIGAIPFDAEDPASIESALAQSAASGPIDGFVFLTGYSNPPTRANELPLSEWDRVQSINVRSAFVALKAVAPLMRRPGGSIVFVSSGLAVNVEPGFAAYSASKAALIALAKVAAKEHAPDLRVNIVAPGLVDTPFLSGGTSHRDRDAGEGAFFKDASFRERIEATILMRRIAVPADVVAPILFLLGGGARYLTGQTIHVNGGRFMP
jgi:3-oxoacyl-[acyl-carrier protein] reductase